MFFAQNTVFWAQIVQKGAHRGLSGTVGFGHRVKAIGFFVVGLQIGLTKIGQDGRARGIGQTVRDIDI